MHLGRGIERPGGELPRGVRGAREQEHRDEDRDEGLEPPHADPCFRVTHNATTHNNASRASSAVRSHWRVYRTVTSPGWTGAAIAQP